MVLQEYKNNAIEVYEVMRKKKVSKFLFFLDFFISGADTVSAISDSLGNGNFYICINKDRSLLIEVNKETVISEVDVSHLIDKNKPFKSIVLDDYNYKKIRKIK